MTYGLRSISDAGTVLIDTESTVLSLTAKGSTSFAATSTAMGTQAVATVTISGSEPVLAFASAHRCAIVDVAQSGSAWTFTLYGKDAAGAALNWWAFDHAPLAAGPGAYGIRLRRADGSVAWHDGIGPLRIVDLIGAGGSFSGSGSYAVAQAGFGGHRDLTVDPDTGTTDIFTILGASASGGAVSAGFDTYRSAYLPHATGPSSETETFSSGAFLVIDVTGL